MVVSLRYKKHAATTRPGGQSRGVYSVKYSMGLRKLETQQYKPQDPATSTWSHIYQCQGVEGLWYPSFWLKVLRTLRLTRSTALNPKPSVRAVTNRMAGLFVRPSTLRRRAERGSEVDEGLV